MKKLLIAFIICLLPSFGWAYTEEHYVCSNGNGAGATDGTSEANCFDGISDISWDTDDQDDNNVGPNDALYLCTDGVYRELVQFNQSGLAGKPITILAQTGETPIVNGSDDVIGVAGDWSEQGDGVWRKDIGATEPLVVWFNTSQIGTEDATPDTEYEWTYSNPNLDVYTAAGDNNPASYYSVIEAAQRAGINDNNTHYQVVDGITITKTNTSGISLGGASGANTIEIKNCIITETAQSGIWIDDGAITITDNTISHSNRSLGNSDCSGIVIAPWGGRTVTAGTVQGNTISYVYGTTGQGITIGGTTDATDDVTISKNTITHAYDDGIKLYCGNNIVIEYNLLHDGGDSEDGGNTGIQVYAQAGKVTSAIVRYNRVYAWAGGGIIFHGADGTVSGSMYYNIATGNMTHAANAVDGGEIKLYTTTGILVYNNTVYGGGEHGISLVTTTNCIVKNNIISTNTDKELFASNTTNLTLDYNCYYRASGDSISYDGTGYSIAELINGDLYSDESQEQNIVVADPLFTDAANDDFTLASGSPCRNAGVDLGDSYDDALNPYFCIWPDNVNTFSQDNFGFAWEIGAYISVIYVEGIFRMLGISIDDLQNKIVQ